MRKIFLLVVLIFVAVFVEARPLQNLPGYSWEVVPTNPLCVEDSSIRGMAPANAWCRKADLEQNLRRSDTPEFKLIASIQDPEVTHIRMAYLSFGNERVSRALCEALHRGVRVELILDSSKPWPVEQELKNCDPNKFVFYSRGNVGALGFAHNKVTLFTRKSSPFVEIVLGSGNLTLGTILTHENWHFVTAPKDSHFVSLHECLWQGMVQHGESLKVYAAFIQQCRSSINAPPESGIEVFFIPGEGGKMLSRLEGQMKSAEWVGGASHRFNGDKVTRLVSNVLGAGVLVKMVFDDDLYWAGLNRKGFGLNQYSEAKVVRGLEKQGLLVKYVQTNHKDHLIHHNKFFVWGQGSQAQGAFFGAGNLTNSAFTKNFENFYLVTVPEVAEDMHRYQQHLWGELASDAKEMPQSPR